jgi:hypothetical protein
MNVEIGTEAAQFLFWEYINWIFVAVYTYIRILQLNNHFSRRPGHCKVRTFPCGKISRISLSYSHRPDNTSGQVQLFKHKVSSRQGLTNTSNVYSVSTPSLWKDLQIISICICLCFRWRKLAGRGRCWSGSVTVHMYTLKSAIRPPLEIG